MDYKEKMIERLKELRQLKDELEAKLTPVIKEYESITQFLNQMGVSIDDTATETMSSTAVTSDYPIDKSLNEKVKYILSIKGEATSPEIEDFINSKESSPISKGYLSVTLSGLSKDEEIKVVGKKGRANIYSL